MKFIVCPLLCYNIADELELLPFARPLGGRMDRCVVDQPLCG